MDSFARNKHKHIAPSNMYNDSVIPRIEFSMILGSNAKINTATNGYGLITNLFAIKYTGIIVRVDNPILSNLWRFIKSIKFVDGSKEKKNERNIGHPSFGKTISGYCFNTLVSIPNIKYAKASAVTGNS